MNRHRVAALYRRLGRTFNELAEELGPEGDAAPSSEPPPASSRVLSPPQRPACDAGPPRPKGCPAPRLEAAPQASLPGSPPAFPLPLPRGARSAREPSEAP